MSSTSPLPGWDCHTHVFDGRGGAAAGHYRPPERPLGMLEAQAATIGATRIVLVQPSVYGTDNSLLLEALRTGGGRHRGVVVVAPDAPRADLEAMHALGVRGVRFNLVSPVGNRAETFAALAPVLLDLGWHVQWYTTPDGLATIAPLHQRFPLRCVLDHMAGFTPRLARDARLWDDLQDLAARGAWLKLSGWYRLAATLPYEELDATIARAAALFDTRCVWGSDWPHTYFLEPGRLAASPPYAGIWQPVPRALGEARAQRILREHPPALYE